MRGENTVDRAVENIVHHYDLSNELFALFLDETMTYSCAVFEPGDTLAQAQERKYERLCAMLDLARTIICSRSVPAGVGWPSTRPAPVAAGSPASRSPRASERWRSSGSPRPELD